MLAALISGGLIGTIGSIFNNLLGFFKRKEDNKQALKMGELDIKKQDQELSFKLQNVKIESETKLVESADDLKEVSYNHDQFSFTKGQKLSWFERTILVFLDTIRGLVRPALTVFLIWQVHLVRIEVAQIIKAAGGDPISNGEAVSIYMEVVRMILFLTSTAVSWWFGSRGQKDKQEPAVEEIPKPATSPVKKSWWKSNK